MVEPDEAIRSYSDGPPQKKPLVDLQQALAQEALAKRGLDGALTDVLAGQDRRLKRAEHEITRLKFGTVIKEMQEEAKQGGVFHEVGMFIRLCKHAYEFAAQEGLVPKVMQKYFGNFKRLIYLFSATAVATTVVGVGSLVYVANKNSDLMNLSNVVQSDKNEIAQLKKDIAALRGGYEGSLADMNGDQALAFTNSYKTLRTEIQGLMESSKKYSDSNLVAAVDGVNKDFTGVREAVAGLPRFNTRLTQTEQFIATIAPMITPTGSLTKAVSEAATLANEAVSKSDQLRKDVDGINSMGYGIRVSTLETNQTKYARELENRLNLERLDREFKNIVSPRNNIPVTWTNDFRVRYR